MKKILILILMFGLISCSVSKKATNRSIPDLNFGTGPNSGTGESVNSAMQKIQLLFDEANRLGFTEDLTTAVERNLLHGVANQKDIRDIAPMYYHAAGDTSNYPVPAKIGDFYSDDSSGKLYYAKTAARLGWIKLN